MDRCGDNVSLEQRIMNRILAPFVTFYKIEASGGIALIACTLVAVFWANSNWAESYTTLFQSVFSISIGDYGLTKPLILWINDGLMAIFFFMVGLEIKREILVGELNSLKKASLPIAAALGGMIVPAIIYFVINTGTQTATGWGIPMATDIAFALGILALLGDRVPTNLKIFLAAVAIVDDIGAVLVIAFFYTAEISSTYLWWAGACFLALAFFNAARVRSPLPYILVSVVMWFFFLKSGIHATVAGVLAAMTIPALTKCDATQFLEVSRDCLIAYEKAYVPGKSVLNNHDQLAAIEALEKACHGAETPLQRIEHALHPWVAYLIMPIFALANAGVVLSANIGAILLEPVSLGILLGLVVGKVIGVTLASLGTVKSGLATLPSGVSVQHILGAGCLAGIGFTMSIFIASLAFPEDSAAIEHAKLAILGASVLAGGLGTAVLLKK